MEDDLWLDFLKRIPNIIWRTKVALDVFGSRHNISLRTQVKHGDIGSVFLFDAYKFQKQPQLEYLIQDSTVWVIIVRFALLFVADYGLGSLILCTLCNSCHNPDR